MSNLHALQSPPLLLERSDRNRLGLGGETRVRGEVFVLFKLWWCLLDGAVSESERMLLSTELTLSKSIASSPPVSGREGTLEQDTMGLSSLAVALGVVLTAVVVTGWGSGSSSKQELDDVSTFFVILANSFEEVLLRVGVCEDECRRE